MDNNESTETYEVTVKGRSIDSENAERYEATVKGRSIDSKGDETINVTIKKKKKSNPSYYSGGSSRGFIIGGSLAGLAVFGAVAALVIYAINVATNKKKTIENHRNAISLVCTDIKNGYIDKYKSYIYGAYFLSISYEVKSDYDLYYIDATSKVCFNNVNLLCSFTYGESTLYNSNKNNLSPICEVKAKRSFTIDYYELNDGKTSDAFMEIYNHTGECKVADFENAIKCLDFKDCYYSASLGRGYSFDDLKTAIDDNDYWSIYN